MELPHYNTRNISMDLLTAINNLINAILNAQDVLGEMSPRLLKLLRDILTEDSPYYPMLYPRQTFDPIRISVRPVCLPDEYLPILPPPRTERTVPILIVPPSLPTILPADPLPPEIEPAEQNEHQPTVPQYSHAGPPPPYPSSGPSVQPIPVVKNAQLLSPAQLEQQRLEMNTRHEDEMAYDTYVKQQERIIYSFLREYYVIEYQLIIQNLMETSSQNESLFEDTNENFDDLNMDYMTTSPPSCGVSEETMNYVKTQKPLPALPPMETPLPMPIDLDSYIQSGNSGTHILPDFRTERIQLPSAECNSVYCICSSLPAKCNVAANKVSYDRQSVSNWVSSSINQLLSSAGVSNAADADASVAGPSDSPSSSEPYWSNQQFPAFNNPSQPEVDHESCDSKCTCRTNEKPN